MTVLETLKKVILALVVINILGNLALIVHEAFEQPITIKELVLPMSGILISVSLYYSFIKKMPRTSGKKTLHLIFMIGFAVSALALALLYRTL